MTIFEPVRIARTFLNVLLAAAACASWAGTAEAACFAGPAPARPSLQRGPAQPLPGHRAAGLATASVSGLVRTIADEGPSAATPVGLWNAEFFLGDGPDRYDQTFQQFHIGGTELMLSNGLPPVLGNVCVGIWKHAGRTVKVKHMAWNWEASGAFAGTFLLEIELRIARDGRSYTGRWTADSFDPDGALIPAMHAEGVARARRISID